MTAIGDEYYNHAIHQIDNLEPFIELVTELKAMADEGRVNDMRRRLVVFTVDRESALSQQHEREKRKIRNQVLKEVLGKADSLHSFGYVYGDYSKIISVESVERLQQQSNGGKHELHGEPFAWAERNQHRTEQRQILKDHGWKEPS